MLQAVIFDYDGTLVDTETLLEKANDAVCRQFGVPYDSAAFRARVMAHPDPEYTATLKEVCRLPGSIDEVIAARHEAYRHAETETGLHPKPGADALVRQLHDEGYKLAIATSSGRAHVERDLERLGWNDLFDDIVDYTDVAHPKPAPDIYREAARRLRCEDGSCIAIDDSPAGVASAKDAGLLVIGLLDRRYVHELPDADRIVESLEEVSVGDLEEMAGGDES